MLVFHMWPLKRPQRAPQDERLRYVALQRPETDDLTVGAKRSFVEEGFSPFLGFHETNQQRDWDVLGKSKRPQPRSAQIVVE